MASEEVKRAPRGARFVLVAGTEACPTGGPTARLLAFAAIVARGVDVAAVAGRHHGSPFEGAIFPRVEWKFRLNTRGPTRWKTARSIHGFGAVVECGRPMAGGPGR